MSSYRSKMQTSQQNPLHAHHSMGTAPAHYPTMNIGGRGDSPPNDGNCKFRMRLLDDTPRSNLIQGFVHKTILERDVSKPIGVLVCPFLPCKATFTVASHLIDHMRTCNGYASGEFLCPDCNSYEPIPVPKDLETKHGWIKQKASSLVRRLSGRRSPSSKSSAHKEISSASTDRACEHNSKHISDGLMVDPPRASSTLEPIQFVGDIDNHIANDQLKHLLRSIFAPQTLNHRPYPQTAGPVQTSMGPQFAAPSFPQLNTIDWSRSQSSATTSFGSSYSSFDPQDNPMFPAKAAQGQLFGQFDRQPAHSQPLFWPYRSLSKSPTLMEPHETPNTSADTNTQWFPELSDSSVIPEIEGSSPPLQSMHRPVPLHPSKPDGAGSSVLSYANAPAGSIDNPFYTTSHRMSETRLSSFANPPTPVRTGTADSSSTNQDSGYGSEWTASKGADITLSPLGDEDDWDVDEVFSPSPPASERGQSPIHEPGLISPPPEALPNVKFSGELVCPECGYAPRGKEKNRRRYLKRHMEIHKNLRFECERCTSVYNRKDNLAKHLKDDHPACSARPVKRPIDEGEQVNNLQSAARGGIKRPRTNTPLFLRRFWPGWKKAVSISTTLESLKTGS